MADIGTGYTRLALELAHCNHEINKLRFSLVFSVTFYFCISVSDLPRPLVNPVWIIIAVSSMATLLLYNVRLNLVYTSPKNE